MTEQLKDLHQKTLAKMLHLLLTTVDRLEREPPISGPAHEVCQCALLGRLIRELSQHGLWPLANVQLDHNIETTLSILRRASLPFSVNNSRDHVSCSQVIDDMRQELNNFENVTLELTKAQMTHLRKKARENGIGKPQVRTRSQKKRGKNNRRVVEVVEIKDED